MKILKVLILAVSLSVFFSLEIPSGMDQFRRSAGSIFNYQNAHKAKRGGEFGFVSQQTTPLFSASDVEILDTIFGTLEMADKHLPPVGKEQQNLVSETLTILGVDQGGSMNMMIKEGPVTIQYSLGSIQDSFMNLDTFKIPKKSLKNSQQEDQLFKSMMSDVWTDMIREINKDLNVAQAVSSDVTLEGKEVEKPAAKNLLNLGSTENPHHQNEEVRTETKENSEMNFEVVKDKDASSSLLGVVAGASLVIIGIFVALVMMNRKRKAGKANKDRYDDERVPLASIKGHKML